MTQQKYLVRYSWHVGDLGFWDNRATMHFVVIDYGDQHRLIQRVTLSERPYWLTDIVYPLRSPRCEAWSGLNCSPTGNGLLQVIAYHHRQKGCTG